MLNTFYRGEAATRKVFRSDGSELDPGPSLEICNHSPDGFAWGYSGSGPSQLALAILFDILGDVAAPEKVRRQIALEGHHEFKGKFLVDLEHDKDFRIPAASVTSWLVRRKFIECPAWTAVLLYPDWCAQDYGADLYIGTAHCRDPKDAPELVAEYASHANEWLIPADDYRAILVLEGMPKIALTALEM